MKQFSMEMIGYITWIVLAVLILVGEAKCVVKAIECNWAPIGKAEIIYTASALTGVGCIVGYFNIDDK